MKCVCTQDCYIPNNAGKNQLFVRGDVHEFDEMPDHFRAIKGSQIDFATAGEQELLAADFDLDELKKFIENKYDRKAGNRGKEKTIDMLLDSRYRHLDVDPNTMV